MKYDPKIIISDIRTFQIMSNNQNYFDRLYEAYKYIKQQKITSKEKFEYQEERIVGAFTYEEITIFDRLKNEEYKKIISNSWKEIHHGIDSFIEDKEYGDFLASHGRLGYTPQREELIKQGAHVYGLTNEEQQVRDKVISDIREKISRKNK